MSFPFALQDKELEEADLDLFYPEFVETVSLFLPCTDVHFAGPHSGGELSSRWKAGVEMVRSEHKPVLDGGDEGLYLPLWSGDSLLGVAILNGCPAACKEKSSTWLLEKSRLISREMARVKGYALDSVTGLPGGQALRRRLDTLLEAARKGEGDCTFSLSLLDLHPRARDADHALAVINRSAAFLSSLIGHLFTPCHLGNGVFGLLWQDISENQALKMADMLLRWLKREGFPRSWIGVRSFACEKAEISGEVLLAQAWEALTIAGKRGPFALCSYQAVSNKSAHPLCPPKSRVVAELRKMWTGDDSFGLVLLHMDEIEKGGHLVLPDSLPGPVVDVNEQEVFVYLPGVERGRVEEWCRDFQTWATGRKISFSIGAALYPHADFKKNDIVSNCRKALLHTGFFGPGSTTFFDAVSLNISGDIYYNEGDLARAVKEYRLGLQLDTENINLLNSLGVTLAQMDQYNKAISLFGEALQIDPSDFMALFNLGFAYMASGDEARAFENFEKALHEKQDNFDLLLQLGKLYCQAGRYADAVHVLRKGEQVGPVGVRDISHGAVYRYLGEAHRGLVENKKAMACLQRACRHNPRDAAALSLLGELYCREGEGGEVALSLCRQAVELEGSDWRHWSRLAVVCTELGHYDDALVAVRTGLSFDRKNSDLLFQLGVLYQQQGKISLACKVFQKIKQGDGCYAEAFSRLALLEK